MPNASTARSSSSFGIRAIAPIAASILLGAFDLVPLRAIEVMTQSDRLEGLLTEEDGQFGARVAMSRSAGNSPFVVAGGPHAGGGGELALFQYEDDIQWEIDLSLPFFEAQSIPVDLESGVAIYAHRFGSTTLIRSLLGNGDVSDIQLPTLISGAVGSVAVDWDFFDGVLAIGQPDFALGAGRVLIFEGTFGGPFTLVHSDACGAGDRLGESLAMCHGAIIAGKPGEGANGSVEVYLRTTEWTHWQELDSPAVSQSDAAFGAVVAISEDCRWIAVGSPDVDRTSAPEYASDIGAVYMYESSIASWVFRSLLRPAGARADDRFGASVAIHDQALVAGSPGRDESEENQGAAYVYQLAGSTWRERLQLVDSSADEDDLLGASVAIGDLGALVGAPLRDVLGILDSGMVNFYPGVAGLFFDDFESGNLETWSHSEP